jgi:hypothetical protein
MIAPTASRFQGIRPLYAWLLLGLLLGLSAYGVCIRDNTKTLTIETDNPDLTDYALYQRIVDRVHAGEGYYEATGAELRGRGSPVRPVFTWRLPTVACFTALYNNPEETGFAIIALAMAATYFWVRCLKDDGVLWMAIVGGVMLLPSMGIWALKPGYLFHETWSGLCIALSLALYARGHWRSSVVFGIAALSLRELALPFVAVMLTMACWQRRKGEALAWCLGLVGFAVFLGFHAWMVSRQLTAEDVRFGPGWLHMIGWPFVIKTARANVMLLLLPSWVAGLVLPFLLLGLAGWKSPAGTRVALTVGVYVVAFLFAGRLYHSYWGVMYANLLPLGLVFAPRAVGDLLRALPKKVSG